MIALILLSCLFCVGSSIPLSAKPAPPLESHLSPRIHGAAEATVAQTPAPPAPVVEQSQPSSQPMPNPQLLPPLQQYPWAPLGGTPMIFPYQPNIVGPQPAANQPAMPIQPLVFPPFGYMPLFPPHTNQMLSPYRLPEAPLPQAPANPAPNVLPAERSLTAAPGGEVLQTQQQQQQQQQSPQVIYMMQQPAVTTQNSFKNPQLGGLSSEELQLVAKLSQLGLYPLRNNAGGGELQQLNPAAGIPNQVNAEVGVLPAGVQKISGPHRHTGGTPCSKKQQNIGLQRAVAEPDLD